MESHYFKFPETYYYHKEAFLASELKVIDFTANQKHNQAQSEVIMIRDVIKDLKNVKNEKQKQLDKVEVKINGQKLTIEKLNEVLRTND